MQPCVTTIDHAVPFKSKDVTWSSGQGANDFPVDFLDSAVKGMDDAYLDELLLRVSVNYTTAASTGSSRGQLLPQMLDRILIRDGDGPRIDVRGSSLRVQLQMEDGTGLGYDDAANQGAGANVTTVFFLRIPTCSPVLAENPRDFRWDVRKLRDGGQILIDFGTSPFGPDANHQLTVVSATVTLWAFCVDEHRHRDPSRMILREWTIYTSDQTFPLGADNGTKIVKMRSAVQYIGQVGESKVTPDAFAAQKIVSRALQYFSVQDDVLNERYRAQRPFRYPDPAGVLSTTDAYYNKYALPLFAPGYRQQITEMVDCGSFDWRTDLTFGSGTFVSADAPKMIFTYVEDNPAIACGDVSGSTKLESYGAAPPSALQEKLRAKLPRHGASKG